MILDRATSKAAFADGLLKSDASADSGEISPSAEPKPPASLVAAAIRRGLHELCAADGEAGSSGAARDGEVAGGVSGGDGEDGGGDGGGGRASPTESRLDSLIESGLSGAAIVADDDDGGGGAVGVGAVGARASLYSLEGVDFAPARGGAARAEREARDEAALAALIGNAMRNAAEIADGGRKRRRLGGEAAGAADAVDAAEAEAARLAAREAKAARAAQRKQERWAKAGYVSLSLPQEQGQRELEPIT